MRAGHETHALCRGRTARVRCCCSSRRRRAHGRAGGRRHGLRSHHVRDPAAYSWSEETATVTNLAQQLRMRSRTPPAAAPASGNRTRRLLTNLGGLISEQQGLSYSVQGLAQQFQQLYPGYNVTSVAGVQSPQASVDTTLNTLNGALQSAQSQAQNFTAEQTALQSLELKNQTAVGNLQAVQVATRSRSPRSSRSRCSASSSWR